MNVSLKTAIIYNSAKEHCLISSLSYFKIQE